MKTVLKVFGILIAIPLCFVLLVAQAGLHTSYAAQGLLSEDTIGGIIDDIDVGELLEKVGGEEANAAISEALSVYGIPEETVTQVINSQGVKNIVGGLLSGVVAAATSGDESAAIDKAEFKELIDANLDNVLETAGVSVSEYEREEILNAVAPMYNELMAMLDELMAGQTPPSNEGGGVSASEGGIVFLSAETAPTTPQTQELTLRGLVKYITGETPLPDNPFEIYRLATGKAVRQALFIIAGLMFLLICFMRWSFIKGIRWCAVVTLIVGLFVLFIGLAMNVTLLSKVLALTGAPESVTGIIDTVIKPVLDNIKMVFIKNGGIAAGIGLVLIVLMGIIRGLQKKSKAKKDAQPEEKIALADVPVQEGEETIVIENPSADK